MKLAEMTIDITALGILVGVVNKVLPALAGLLAIVYYGFVIYDRIKYGPEIEGRLSRRLKKEKPDGEPSSE